MKQSALFRRALRAEQKGNRQAYNLWDRFRSHRERVTAEILALAPNADAAGGGRLAVLGAGNANDLDLEALSTRFDEIHLVDIDPAAVAAAIERQDPAVKGKLRSHAPVDLSGLYHQLGRPNWPAADAMVAEGTAKVLQQLPSNFDVVASCCVASQMSWALANFVSGGGQGLPMLEQALLRIHLRTLLRLIRPGGSALLVSDLTSSLFFPLGALQPGDDLRRLVAALAAERRAYTVTNPELVQYVLGGDPELAATCQPPTLGEPWLWCGPKNLTYLVYPFVLRRRT